ncbi:MAG: ferrous iron transport protein A [Bacteroidota bacterium]|nr:ferrous iron transport protein A [Bacteroidota bacterium]
MNVLSLNHLTVGEKGTVQNITNASSQIRQRLLEMGLTKGTTIEVVRFAPMGDPMEIAIRGYRLSLRRLEAESVFVQKEMQ